MGEERLSGLALMSVHRDSAYGSSFYPDSDNHLSYDPGPVFSEWTTLRPSLRRLTRPVRRPTTRPPTMTRVDPHLFDSTCLTTVRSPPGATFKTLSLPHHSGSPGPKCRPPHAGGMMWPHCRTADRSRYNDQMLRAGEAGRLRRRVGLRLRPRESQGCSTGRESCYHTGLLVRLQAFPEEAPEIFRRHAATDGTTNSPGAYERKEEGEGSGGRGCV